MASVVLNPSSATVLVGDTVRVTAAAQDASGTSVVDPVLAWTSSDPAVASVSQSGLVTAAAHGAATILAASPQGPADSVSVTVLAAYDPDAQGTPRVIELDYIDLSAIARISRFRSGIGHDYSDALETCRSMKHYYQPRGNVDWASLAILAPVSGEIVELLPEQTFGTQVRIVPTSFPAATVVIFHLSPRPWLAEGVSVTAGDTLGTHIGSQTMSDVAIRVRTDLQSYRLVSYIEAMPDSVFDEYVARGILTRDSLVIGRSQRDQAPLLCSGETFADPGTVENWVTLP